MYTIPEEVLNCLHTLRSAGYESYLVGGCVRDLLRGAIPADYDVATTASPTIVTQLFPKVVATGERFGTVTVIADRPIEVTTFRVDGRYSDGRHPDQVLFTDDVRQDLARRDFTVNAMALDPADCTIIDPFSGQHDLSAGLLRAVGDPDASFGADGLRLLRAARFMAQLNFTVEPSTASAMVRQAERLCSVSGERIGRELASLLTLSTDIFPALTLLVQTGLLRFIVPELLSGDGAVQSRLHREDVLTHNLRTCSLTPPVLALRLAGLLHDVGKPGFHRQGPHGRIFPGHAARSAAIVPDALERLRYPRKLIRQVSLLVRHHMLFWRAGQDLAPIRRLAGQVGWENFDLVLQLITADRLAIWGDESLAGIPELLVAGGQVISDRPPVLFADLALTSRELMGHLRLEPGPKLGEIRQHLLKAVWESPAVNQPAMLLALARQYMEDSAADGTVGC